MSLLRLPVPGRSHRPEPYGAGQAAQGPVKVVPTFNAREVTRLLTKPDKTTNVGFRDYALLLTFVDTGARLSEVTELTVEDVDVNSAVKAFKIIAKSLVNKLSPTKNPACLLGKNTQHK